MRTGSGTLINNNLKQAGVVFVLLTLLSGWNFAQYNHFPSPNLSKPNYFTNFSAKKHPEKLSQNRPDDLPFETSIEVDSNVNVGLCVSEGNIRINGWDRNEIRVFINEGTKAGFRIVKKNSQNKPAWVTILGHDPVRDRGKDSTPCLAGETIEIDVPRGTILSRMEGREAEVDIKIEAIAKAVVKINSGSIRLSDISKGIDVRTFAGDINLENSSGTVRLEATDGNIFAYNLEADEIGDTVRVKSNNGNVVLQSVRHTVVEATSISGLIKFTGEIQAGGDYKFNNTSGQILLSIPRDTNCSVQVYSEKGKFTYDVPLKIVNETVFPPSMQKIIGKIGEGEANINLLSPSGIIRIRKIN